MNTPSDTSIEIDTTRWQQIVARYAQPDLWRSIWQVIDTLLPFFALWAVMVFSVHVSYWLTLLLAFPTAGFMVRTFIIFHDCGHGSFFKSHKANDILGTITGILTFTPYIRWRHDHAIHHATSSDLDRRGVGDVETMTVKEYMAAPWWKKAAYKITRNPILMFTIGSFLVFTAIQRFPGPRDGRKERASVWWTDLALAALVGLLIWLLGWRTFLLVELPVMTLGFSAGVWLFYVQHNFDPTYWEHHKKWEFFKAGFEGSSFYKLPRILQWFTGNIGYHHIHHLSPKIPNYRLPECHRENPFFQVPPMDFWASLRSLRMRLYDEENHRMVGWDVLKRFNQKQLSA